MTIDGDALFRFTTRAASLVAYLTGMPEKDRAKLAAQWNVHDEELEDWLDRLVAIIDGLGGGTLILTDLRGATATTDMLSMGVTGDAFNRFVLDADGTMWTGTGATAPVIAIRADASSATLGRNAGGVSTAAVVAVGGGALFNNTTGVGNVAVGQSALLSNTTGFTNVAVGNSALALNVSGDSNVAVGTSALSKCTTDNNTAVGDGAMSNTTTGGSNTATGSLAMSANTTGVFNTAAGVSALAGNTTGRDNTAFGARALRGSGSTTTGSRQVGVGYWAGQATGTQRSDIVAVGYEAEVDADNTVAIGSGAQALHAGSTALGMGVVTTAADQVELGAKHIEITEIADPAAGAANSARLYTRDNGAGKTQLCVRFATGAVQVLATEP